MEQPAPIDEVYAVFCGVIDTASVQRIVQGVTTVMASGGTHLHLLFQSTGGMVGDGVCLYNFLRTCPLTITLYNVGSVLSIGTIAYLGAKERKTSAHATFMVHRSAASPPFASAARLKGVADGLVLDDQRTEAILRDHLDLSEGRWAEWAVQEVFLSAAEAVEVGLAHSISDFSPPLGTQVFNI